ncbi:MAG: type II toxin-antitoxin system Phd/YefM family antitoxin [Methanoculleus sp.]
MRRSQKLSSERYVVDGHGNRVAVIPPCRRTSDARIDLHDLAVVAERREEPAMGFGEFRER